MPLNSCLCETDRDFSLDSDATLFLQNLHQEREARFEVQNLAMCEVNLPLHGIGMKHPAGQYAHTSKAAETQARMPGPEWKEKKHRDKFGPAGVDQDHRRKSPIVEISVLLVSRVSVQVSSMLYSASSLN